MVAGLRKPQEREEERWCGLQPALMDGFWLCHMMGVIRTQPKSPKANRGQPKCPDLLTFSDSPNRQQPPVIVGFVTAIVTTAGPGLSLHVLPGPVQQGLEAGMVLV